MSDINEDLLNVDDDLPVEELDFEAEQALLEDEEVQEDENELDGNDEDVLDLNAEDDFAGDKSVLEIDLDDSVGRKEKYDKFSSEKETDSTISTSSNNAKQIFRRKPQFNKNANNIQRRNFQRPDQRGGNLRGRIFRNMQNNGVKRNNKVFINPTFNGVIHVNNNSARLAYPSDQTKPISPWVSGAVPNSQQQCQIIPNQTLPMNQSPFQMGLNQMQHMQQMQPQQLPIIQQPQQQMQMMQPPPPQMQMMQSPIQSYNNNMMMNDYSHPPPQVFVHQPLTQVPTVQVTFQARQNLPVHERLGVQNRQVVSSNPFNQQFQQQLPNTNQPPPFDNYGNQMQQPLPQFGGYQQQQQLPAPQQQYSNDYSNNGLNFQPPPQNNVNPVAPFRHNKPYNNVSPHKRRLNDNRNFEQRKNKRPFGNVRNVQQQQPQQQHRTQEVAVVAPEVVKKVPEPAPVEDLEEDEETKQYRMKIEEQKRKREELLRQKEEKRKLLAAQQAATEEGETKPTTITQPVQNIPVLAPYGASHQSKFYNKPKFNPQSSSNIHIKTVKTGRINNNLYNNKINNRVVQVNNSNLTPVATTINIKCNNNDTIVAEEVDKKHISSFLNNRTVISPQVQALPETRLVMVKNLSVSTTDKKILSICRDIGDVQMF